MNNLQEKVSNPQWLICMDSIPSKEGQMTEISISSIKRSLKRYYKIY